MRYVVRLFVRVLMHLVMQLAHQTRPRSSVDSLRPPCAVNNSHEETRISEKIRENNLTEGRKQPAHHLLANTVLR